MKIYQGFNEAKSRVIPGVYAIGNFDGVHLGHLSLLNRVAKLARELDVATGVYTFWPHPQAVLNPKTSPQLICTRDQKIQLLQRHGVEQIIEEPFTLEFAGILAETFVKEIVLRIPGIRAVIVGENFRFGRNAEGNPEKLRKWLELEGIACEIMPPFFVDHEVCSSSRVRHFVSRGSVAQAASLLGRPYSIVGTVVRGAGRGQSIGIPTANLQSLSQLIPDSGVFATLVRVAGRGELIKSATNIGTRPTFSGLGNIHIETHLLNFEKNIYGEQLEIYFIEKIRNEKKFESADELVKQIHKDLEKASLILERDIAL